MIIINLELFTDVGEAASGRPAAPHFCWSGTSLHVPVVTFCRTSLLTSVMFTVYSSKFSHSTLRGPAGGVNAGPAVACVSCQQAAVWRGSPVKTFHPARPLIQTMDTNMSAHEARCLPCALLHVHTGTGRRCSRGQGSSNPGSEERQPELGSCCAVVTADGHQPRLFAPLGSSTAHYTFSHLPLTAAYHK